MEHIGNMYQDTVSEKSVQDLYYEMEGIKGPNKTALEYKKETKEKKEKRPATAKIEANKEDLGEVREEDIQSDFFEFKKSDEVDFQRFRENKARERMMKNKKPKVAEETVEKNKEKIKQKARPKEVISDV